MRTSIPALAVLCLAMAAGCGGGDDGGGGGSASTKPAAGGDAPAPDTVLDCLKVGGLDAEDQSNSTGEKIGIDYAGGRLLISFEESAEDAESYASVAEANGETAVVKGTVVITVPDDPDAQADQAAVEECVSA
jgi:hypothetical protein